MQDRRGYYRIDIDGGGSGNCLVRIWLGVWFEVPRHPLRSHSGCVKRTNGDRTAWRIDIPHEKSKFLGETFSPCSNLGMGRLVCPPMARRVAMTPNKMQARDAPYVAPLLQTLYALTPDTL